VIDVRPPSGWASEGSGARRLLGTATLVTALYVLDAAVLHRESGTSISDHLPGAAALLGLLAAGALLYDDLRPGGKAVLGILLGVLASTLGALHAVEVAQRGGMRGGDVIGLLTLLAGVVALAVGVVLLWRSRRHDGTRGRRVARRVGILIAAAVVTYYVVFPLLVAIVTTNGPREPGTWPDIGTPAERVALRTDDGLTLQGQYVPSKNGAAVLAFPGREPTEHARMLVGHGYGVLMLDMRGNADSQGSDNAFGWGSGADVAAGLDYIAGRPDVRAGAIGGLGLSVGGELLLQVAATDRRLAATVSEGAGYRTLHEARQQSGLSHALMVPQLAVMYGAIRVLSPEHPPTPLDRLVDRIAPRPVFLIEAEHGQGGEQLSALYYRLAGAPKEYWKVPGAGHTGGLAAQPQEYERRVVDFFDRYLVRGAASP
jgi:dienelactone hydrolase